MEVEENRSADTADSLTALLTNDVDDADIDISETHPLPDDAKPKLGAGHKERGPEAVPDETTIRVSINEYHQKQLAMMVSLIRREQITTNALENPEELDKYSTPEQYQETKGRIASNEGKHIVLRAIDIGVLIDMETRFKTELSEKYREKFSGTLRYVSETTMRAMYVMTVAGHRGAV